MSIRLMSLVWQITWPTQSQLLIALKLADHAHDDGSNVYPAKASVARHAQCCERTVQSTLRAFRTAGLLHVVVEGGQGPKSPTVYQIDVDLLKRLADSNATLTGGADELIIPEQFYPQEAGETADKGATVAPLEPLREQRGTAKGATGDAKGATYLPPNHHIEPSKEPSRADARASNGARARPREGEETNTIVAIGERIRSCSSLSQLDRIWKDEIKLRQGEISETAYNVLKYAANRMARNLAGCP